MLDRPISQWSQTMNRIHSPAPDNESIKRLVKLIQKMT